MCRGVRERVGERLSNLGFDGGFAVDGNCGMQSEAEDSQIIDAHDVIGVRVRHDGRSDQRRSFPHQLNPQFRTCINDKFAFGSADENSGSGAAIAGVVGQADAAAAADHGHTNTGASAHDDHFPVCCEAVRRVGVCLGQVQSSPAICSWLAGVGHFRGRPEDAV